jgi:hypothetical protein
MATKYTTSNGTLSSYGQSWTISTASLTGGYTNGNLYTPNSFSFDTITTDYSNMDGTMNIDGDLKIKGNIFLEGDIYQDEDKVSTKEKEDHDVEIEVVDNGFLGRIGPKTFVFSDLEQLNEWVEENFKTPEHAKETVRKANGRTKEQEDLLDAFRKLEFPKIDPMPFPQIPQIPQQPYKWDKHTYIGDPNQIGTGTGTPQVTWSSTSNTSSDGFLKAIGKKLKGKK